MLYFATQPDPVFSTLISAALTDAATWIDDPAQWRVRAFHAEEGFPRHEAPPEALTRLLAAHRHPSLFAMSHFYWVLLYDCLAAYIAQHNRRIPPRPALPESSMPAVGPFHVGTLDLRSIVAEYFWDLQCFPETVAEHSLVPPPITHRTRGGLERYATPSQGFARITVPRWAPNIDAAELTNPAISIPKYPLSTAQAILEAW